MAIKSWKFNFNVKALNPLKDRINKGKKKTLQFDMIIVHNQRSKKTKHFEKTQIKNLEDPHHTILQFFWQILTKSKLFLGGYLFTSEKQMSKCLSSTDHSGNKERNNGEKKNKGRES